MSAHGRCIWWVVRGVALGLVLGACTLDTNGQGSGSGAVPGADDDATTAPPEASTGGESGRADATGSGGGEGVDGTTTSVPTTATTNASMDEGDESTTGAPVDPCANPPPATFELDVTQAMLSGPMQLGNSPAEGPYAYSEVAGQGRASFQFNVECADEFRAWARVYDPGVGVDGLNPTQPDSFLISFDGEPTVEWLYGCQMIDDAVGGSLWSWERLMDTAPLCAADEFVRTLGPGTHLLHLTNRESGNHSMGEVAAVAHVFITSDPAFVP